MPVLIGSWKEEDVGDWQDTEVTASRHLEEPDFTGTERVMIADQQVAYGYQATGAVPEFQQHSDNIGIHRSPEHQ